MAVVTKTREQLLEVGLRQLRTTGYTATGVKEVLDLAQVPKGSFYHYFPSKEAFVAELLDRYMKIEGERVQRLLGDASLSPLKRLRAYFDELIAVYSRDGEGTGCLIGTMSAEIADHIPKLQVQLHQMYSGWQAGVAVVLQQAIDSGEVVTSSTADALTEFILNSYEGALIRMKADQSQRPMENSFTSSLAICSRTKDRANFG